MNDENLKKGEKTRFSGELAAREAQKKSAASRKRNNSIRKLGLKMLSTPMPVLEMENGQEGLAAVKGLGFDADEPELQMLILARLGTMAIGRDPKIALMATDMLMEITGNDVRSQIAGEQRAIDRERLAFEREKLAAQKRDADDSMEKLDRLLAGIDEAAREGPAEIADGGDGDAAEQ